jgi:hypothetical protein
MDRGFEYLFFSDKSQNLHLGIEDSSVYGDFGYNYEKSNAQGKNRGNDSWVRSKFSPTSFINYRGQKWNRGTYKPYGVEKLNQNRNENESNIDDQHDTTVLSLIKWSNGYFGGNGIPMMRFNAADFAYCKDLDKYPNNRLVVLRRFAGPIGNQLFGPFGPTPISTIVTWFPPEDGGGGSKLPFAISFNEIWEPFSKDIFTVLKETIQSLKLPVGDITPNHPVFKTLQVSLMRKLGITPLDVEGYFGNPNVISSTMARPVANGAGDGLQSEINFTIESAYEFRYVNGVDPATIMLDIIGNICKMGTSDAVFQFTGAFGSGVMSVVNRLMNGDIMSLINDIIQAVITAITTLIKDVINSIKEFATAIAAGGDVGTALLNGFMTTFGKLYFQGVLAEKKPQIMAAVAGATGQPVGAWHVMVGNPKKPIISCGNLVIQGVTLELGNELGFDDWPTTIYATFTLKSARALGSSDIESIYNAGQQRIYYTGFIPKGAPLSKLVQTIPPQKDINGNKINDENTAKQQKLLDSLKEQKSLSNMFEPNSETKDYLFTYSDNQRPLKQRIGTSAAESRNTDNPKKNSYGIDIESNSSAKEARTPAQLAGLSTSDFKNLSQEEKDSFISAAKQEEINNEQILVQSAIIKISNGETPSPDEQAAYNKFKQSEGQQINKK